jgi:uncharacterized membrane protein
MGASGGRRRYRWGLRRERERDPARAEMFSDAVIAIVLTLMAVGLLRFRPERAGAGARVAGL